ncbi:LysR family transcriptional regulator [Halobacteriovorax vibrionivorans]|uniref:LysR family transcriptional regulator n=3 Tax=Halobacteriovorax TaxID=1652133 RepID=A0ABY0IEK8_9BACT|nr:LysR family transcriptional regulator [Halobacteriovorax vibrionivorans]RZF20959.1 LysR family transcriptional regulator [Halobacteriovorax vibrionivorans]
MNIDHISIPTLRVFLEVYQTQNMSQTAKNLAMTQPGVSQHIKSLEGLLQISLFDRINKKVLPTEQAHLLFENCKRALQGLEDALSEVSAKKNKLKGILNIGLPIEFGNNRVLPIIGQWLKLHPEVSIRINYDHAARQSQLLLNGGLDFAITDSFNFPKQIATKNLSSEKLILCCSHDYAKEHKLTSETKFKKTDNLDFIAYLEGAPVITSWFKYHFKKSFQTEAKAQLMDVQGVLRLTLAGVGISVLPLHVLERSDNSKKLLQFNGTKDHMINELNLAYLNARKMGPVALSLFEYLTENI